MWRVIFSTKSGATVKRRFEALNINLAYSTARDIRDAHEDEGWEIVGIVREGQ